MARRLRTKLKLAGKQRFLRYGSGLHVGKGSRLWAPNVLHIGNHVYIGKHVHIEANCQIGDYCLLANRVAILGRRDHDFSAVGYPVRFAPWVGSKRLPHRHAEQVAVIEQDVWIGYGAIILTGVTVGRGAVVAAGTVVNRDVAPYDIVAGAPARVVGRRFADELAIAKHEAMIRTGRFEFSEKGYDHFVIEPGDHLPGGAT